MSEEEDTKVCSCGWTKPGDEHCRGCKHIKSLEACREKLFCSHAFYRDGEDDFMDYECAFEQ